MLSQVMAAKVIVDDSRHRDMVGMEAVHLKLRFPFGETLLHLNDLMRRKEQVIDGVKPGGPNGAHPVLKLPAQLVEFFSERAHRAFPPCLDISIPHAATNRSAERKGFPA